MSRIRVESDQYQLFQQRSRFVIWEVPYPQQDIQTCSWIYSRLICKQLAYFLGGNPKVKLSLKKNTVQSQFNCHEKDSLCRGRGHGTHNVSGVSAPLDIMQ